MATKKKFNVCAPRPKYGHEGETWWHQVGRAIENDRGQITVFFDSVPIPDEKGKVVVMLFEPREKDDTREEKPSSSRAPAAAKGGRRADMDDDIPF